MVIRFLKSFYKNEFNYRSENTKKTVISKRVKAEISQIVSVLLRFFLIFFFKMDHFIK